MISINPDVKDYVPPVRLQTMFSTSKAVISRQGSSSGTEPTGVEAGSDIPAGSSVVLATSNLVLGHSLLDDNKHPREPTSSTHLCLKVFWRNGQLESNEEGSVPTSWIHIMRCARDRHEQNVELVKKDSLLHACTIRKIGQGEELLIWYGERLAREVGVPILTPCHIRGHQEYVCTGCRAHFTNPNTLKAHMFLQCRRSVVIPSSGAGALVPFQRLLQSLSRPPTHSTCGSDKNRKLLRSLADCRLSITSCELRPGCMRCGAQGEESQCRSAFKIPSTSRDVKREANSDDGLMTPDSSTDQSSALNLSVKLAETCSGVENINDISLHAVHPWSTFTAQHMMAQSIALPFDYTPLPGCYPVSPHLHTFGVQFMKCGQTALSPVHPYGPTLERSLCSRGEYSLISPPMETSQERGVISHFKPHSSAASSLIRHARHNNSYGFTLPSDKEPLDLLPQAYFANKSKKGHLCLCCGKLYSRKYGLKIHMRTHNGYKPLKCKICSRPFGDPSNLNKHVRLHAQGETPYRCEFCGKVLVRRRDLERHVRSRHPIDCVKNDDVLGECESSPDSSPISVESSETAIKNTETTYDNC